MESAESSAPEKDVGPGTHARAPQQLHIKTVAGHGEDDNFLRRDSIIAYQNQLDESFSLPVTAERGGNWLYAAMHNSVAMIGSGVLGLPKATAYLEWGGGVTLQVLCWGLSLYSLWQLVTLHEHQGRRFNRYHELGQYAVGPRAGLILVVPFQLIVMVGLSIVYCVTAGKSMQAVWQALCHEPCRPFGLSAWIVVFAGVQLILSQSPNFNSLRGISLLAAIMSVSYSSIAMGSSIAAGRQPDAEFNLDSVSKAQRVFGVFNALGTIAFAYGGHNVALEIQATLPSPPRSDRPMLKGVYLAYTLVAYCYCGVAFAGYAAFGFSVADNVLLTPALIENVPHAVILAADIFVVIHLLGSFQLYSMPVFDLFETWLVTNKWPNGFLVRLAYRSVYVILVGFIAITLPFFGSLLGFIGAFSFGPTTFSLPSFFYLRLVQPRMHTVHFWASWTCLIFGLIITVFGSIGGMSQIIRDASNYSFYQ